MNNRQAVIIVMFDVPSKNQNDRKAYYRFRKNLLKNGYIMFQKSVYLKLLNNISSYTHEKDFLQSVCPENGNVCSMTTTKNEFKNNVQIFGREFNVSLLCDDVLFIG